MDKLLSLMQASAEFTELLAGIDRQLHGQYVYGLTGSQKTFTISAIRKMTDRPMVIITNDQMQAEKMRKDICVLLPNVNCEIFPTHEILSFEVFSQNRDFLSKRLALLNRIVSGENMIVIAPVKALMKGLVSPLRYRDSLFRIEKGQSCDLSEMSSRLVLQGYERVSMVEKPGQFGIRGGILDIFSDGQEHPTRIEFFGNEVDSMRTFDPLSQRSVSETDYVDIGPASELIIDSPAKQYGVEMIRSSLANQLKKTKQVEKKNTLRGKIERLIDQVSEGAVADLNPTVLPFFTDQTYTLFSYMPEGTVVMIDEATRLQETAENYQALIHETFSNSMTNSTVLPEQLESLIFWEQLAEHMKRFPLILWSSLLRQTTHFSLDRLHSFSARPLYPYMGSIDTLIHEIQSFVQGGYRVILAASTKERAVKLQEILANHDMETLLSPVLEELPDPGKCMVTVGAIETGFEFPLLELAVIVDDEISGRKPKSRSRIRRKDVQSFNWQDLKAGEYVVHVNHGIGKFSGVSVLEIEGVKKDFLIIHYKDQDRVYVPVDQMGMVQRYVGADGHEPKINRLGGADWQKAKLSAKKAVAEMAEELLKLYAVRESVKGFSFSPDTPWQKDFEGRFEYQETDDQLKAVEDVKDDMEKTKPMDRLLCGDVGYGKTEVAIRAAFKAVMDGKQTGVLVPTTVLAQQHFNTFHGRFQGYPVKIEMMSRFVSEAKQKEVIQGLKAGTVDIVIGTHRLLQEDMQFKDLGLLIVDEEQRFGVKHKERIKEMRTNVDVLTLTATPIPRTLHMALSGIRDMSMIMEPPEDRIPVQTFVLEENDTLIRDVIHQEIGRGGQVYYVHNKIKTIERAARKLQRLLPEAEIAIGHGQMKEDELERTMIDFIEKETDILVCTTIIETGMDIPNVNTIIIEDADHFGLSQLYQLRGRVGRSHRQGYCYLLFKRNKVLTEIADKRLEAIKEFTEFGSGFKIAMKDLEIRGAGNLLGSEQHGHLSAVGFEMYCRLLEEAVNEAKGNVEVRIPEPLIDIKVDAYLSDDYIPDSQQKIEIYKKIAISQTEEELRDIIDEMVDRFGDLPIEAEQLLDIIRLKNYAREVFVDSLNHSKDCILIKLSNVSCFDQSKVAEGIRQYDRRLSMVASARPYLSLNVEGMTQKSILRTLKDILRTLQACLEVKI